MLRPPLVGAIAAVLVTAALLAGCSRGGGTTATTSAPATTAATTAANTATSVPARTTATTTATPTTSSTATATTATTAGVAPSTSASAPATSAAPGTTVAPALPDIRVTAWTPFVSPSGNIGCGIEASEVRCDIGDRAWQPPPRPADCPLDFGQGLVLNAGGGAALVCAGDTLLRNGGQVLAYGQSIVAGSLRCRSDETGMSCRDQTTGRGFDLSRASYQLH